MLFQKIFFLFLSSKLSIKLIKVLWKKRKKIKYKIMQYQHSFHEVNYHSQFEYVSARPAKGICRVFLEQIGLDEIYGSIVSFGSVLSS